MVKIYIGIEDGVIGSVYCDQDAKLCITSLDKDSFPNTLVREESLISTSTEDIMAFIEQAKQEQKQSIKEWNDYQVTEDK